MEHPPYQFTNEDLLKELENIDTQLENMQTDFLRLGIGIAVILLAILAVLFYKL